MNECKLGIIRLYRLSCECETMDSLDFLGNGARHHLVLRHEWLSLSMARGSGNWVNETGRYMQDN